MLKINKVLITSFLILAQLSLCTLLAQNNTNSPYTRFGYGELADRSFGAGRAMGGIGYGLRSPKQINPMNPASYSCMDSLTFLFDFGASGQLSWFQDGLGNKQHDVNGNVEYIAMQFPLHKRIAMSIGLLPYSYVGYKFGEYLNQNGATGVASYSGTGGLSDLYGGISIDLWKKRLSVGANFGYLFGTITHNQTTAMTGDGSANAFNTSRSQSLEVRDMKMDFGIQYTHPISKKENITVGAVFSPKNSLNATSYNIATKYSSNSSTEILSSDTVKNQAFDLPDSYGVGLSYVKQDKLTLATDFLYESWGKSSYFGEKDKLKNRIRVALGGEYIPAYYGKSYFGRIRYRAGVHYSNSYLSITQPEQDLNNASYNEYGVSVGLGLPLIDNRSLVNVSFEYVKKSPDVKVMIDEQYFRFTVNYTFNERWFHKFKLD